MKGSDLNVVVGDASSAESKSFAICPIITLIVGATRKKYYVHKELLIKFSSFFAKCLSAGMVEQDRNQVELPEDTCQQFDVIVDFMYTVPRELEFFAKSADDDSRASSFINLYLTADKYGIPKLQDCIADYLSAGYVTTFVDPYDIALVVERLGAQSLLCKLLGDVFRWDLLERPYAYDHSQLENRGSPPGRVDRTGRDMALKRGAALKNVLSNGEVSMEIFWLSASRAEENIPEWPDCWTEEPCRYHVHSAGEGCWIEGRLRCVYFDSFADNQ